MTIKYGDLTIIHDTESQTNIFTPFNISNADLI